MKKLDMIGKKFGRWTVIEEAERQYGTRAFYLCKCECGTTKIVNGYTLRKGLTKSCGCYNAERIKETGTKRVKHGLSGHRLYRIWSGMKDRCSNSNLPEYPRYGGRGIKVCNEWLDNEKFFEWAFMNGYNDNLTLDRIDNDKDYCPDNCRWSTYAEQANNRKNTRHIEYEGNTYTLSEFSKKFLNINRDTFYSRYLKGLPIEQCMSEVVKANKSI